jgi:hypothetical protein
LRRKTVDCASAAPQNRANHEAVTTILTFPDPTSAQEMALADRRFHDPAHENIRILPVLLFERERSHNPSISRA